MFPLFDRRGYAEAATPTSVTITFQCNSYDVQSGMTNPENLVDTSKTTYASTAINNAYENCPTINYESNDGNTGTITKVEFRIYGYSTTALGYGKWEATPHFTAGDGTLVSIPLGASAAYSSYYDITSDVNAPSPWTWADIANLGMNTTADLASATCYFGIIEFLVTYTPASYDVIEEATTVYGGYGSRTLARDNQGTLYEVHVNRFDTTHYRTRLMKSDDDGTTWTFIIDLANQTNALYPCIAYDGYDMLHFVWRNYTDTTHYYLSYANYNITSAAASTPEWFVFNANTTLYIPSIAVDSHRNVHVVYICWQRKYCYYVERWWSNSTWSTPLRLYDSGAISPDSQKADIVVNGTDDLHVAFSVVNPGVHYYLGYRNCTDGVWGTVSLLFDDATKYRIDPSICIDSQNIIHIAFRYKSASTAYTVGYTNSTSWTLTQVAPPVSNYIIFYPSIGVDKDDTTTITWTGKLFTNYLLRYRQHTGSGWGPTVNITVTSTPAGSLCMLPERYSRMRTGFSLTYYAATSGTYTIFYYKSDDATFYDWTSAQQSGWNTFGNTSDWVQEDGGWNTFGNVSSWDDAFTGWNTFGHTAVWHGPEGWNNFGNTSQYNTLDDGWNTFGNTTSWSQTDGWNTFQNTLTWHGPDGWNTFNNTVGYHTLWSGWTTFGNTSAWRPDCGCPTDVSIEAEYSGDLDFFGGLNVTYQDVHDNGTSNQTYIMGDYIGIGQGYDTVSFPPSWSYLILRGYVFFNLTSIPADAVIDTAHLHCHQFLLSPVVDFTLIVQHNDTVYPHNPLLDTDYNHTYYTGDGGSFNTTLCPGHGKPFDITLNTTGIGWLVPGTISNLTLRSDQDIGSSPPAPGVTEEGMCIYTNIGGGYRNIRLNLTYSRSYPGFCGWNTFGNTNYTVMEVYPETGDEVDPASFQFMVAIDDSNGTLMNVSWEYWDGAAWHFFGSNLTNSGNGTYYKLPSPWFDLYGHTYRYRVTLVGSQTISRDITFTTQTVPGANVDDTMFACIILLVVFGAFLPLGYAVRRRSAGMYLTMAGFTFIGLVAFLPFNAVTLVLMVVFAGYISVLGIKKMFMAKM